MLLFFNWVGRLWFGKWLVWILVDVRGECVVC